MAKPGTSVRRAAGLLAVTPKWVRARIDEGAISPKRIGRGRNGRFAISDEDLDVLRGLAAPAAETAPSGEDALARIGKLEADRANLLARLAWEHATAEATQRALDEERGRVEVLTAEVSAQRTRVEQLKALSVLDRVLGRHKGV